MGIPHLALPLRVDATGRLATVEQDSADEIAQNVAVILATAEGSRVEVPEFGVPRVEFSSRITANEIAAAVEEWELRATLTVDAVTGLGADLSTTVLRALVTSNA